MLDNILYTSVDLYPDKTAIVYDTTTITYADLYDKVIRLSNGLQSIGIEQGACIALVLSNRPEFIISFFAVARNHAIVLPINSALVEEEIKYYIDESGAAAIITDRQKADTCRNIIDSLKRNIKLIVTDDDYPSAISFGSLIASGNNEHDKKVSPFEGEVLYQYSSGTTGRPKRVGRTQKNLFHEAVNFHLTVNTSSADKILCLVPLFHAHGLGNCMLAALYAGATLIILEDVKKNGVAVTVPFVLRRDRVLDLIEQNHVTILPGVPFVFSALADADTAKKVSVSSLRLCFSAGNFFPRDTFDKFLDRFGIAVRQLYGCTEVGSFSINLTPLNELAFDSVGLPMKNNEAKIVDEMGNTLLPGTTGEIAIKSSALTAGYYNRPELNREAFKDGFFLTGDLGRLDDRGFLYITGRKKIFIETGGNKVDPIEVEDVILNYPKVMEVIVVGVQNPFIGETVKAVVVSKGECSEKEILSFCRGKLTDFKIPQLVEFREEIPKSPLGKILRKDLV